MYDVPWEDTGIYEFLIELIEKSGDSVDNCKGKEDIINRYENLDKIFDQVKKERRLRTMEELKPGNFREKGGVLIHIGPGGVPFFGMGGIHRFTMAYILNISIPAQIGCVHVSAIPFLFKFRKEKYE